MTATATIEIDDTVRLTGRRGRGIVTGIDTTANLIQILYTFRGDIGRRSEGTSVRSYAANRVELVRKGNAQADALARLGDERVAAYGESACPCRNPIFNGARTIAVDLPCGCTDVRYPDGSYCREHTHVDCDAS